MTEEVVARGLLQHQPDAAILGDVRVVARRGLVGRHVLQRQCAFPLQLRGAIGLDHQLRPRDARASEVRVLLDQRPFRVKQRVPDSAGQACALENRAICVVGLQRVGGLRGRIHGASRPVAVPSDHEIDVPATHGRHRVLHAGDHWLQHEEIDHRYISEDGEDHDDFELLAKPIEEHTHVQRPDLLDHHANALGRDDRVQELIGVDDELERQCIQNQILHAGSCYDEVRPAHEENACDEEARHGDEHGDTDRTAHGQ
mmetsp:Transcript_78793/g.228784  ORF Transcript_78793/g.228784 Transcript_78793/m.228784 type:complete len:257 (+) Transcript_78793:548-1318(+)